MELYEILKFVHILAAAVWIGAGVAVQALANLARRAGPERMAMFVEDADKLSKRLFMPASFVALGFGIWLVVQGPWDWEDTWIVLGFLGFALTAVTGSAVLGPTSKKIAVVVRERGPGDPEAQKLMSRLINVGRIDLVVLSLVVLDMVVKPGG